MITLKINVSRILKEHLFEGKNGKYLDLVLFENKDGQDKFGNTGFVVQDLGKEARDRGEKGPILGNWKDMERKVAPKPMAPRPAQQKASEPEDDSDSDVPF